MAGAENLRARAFRFACQIVRFCRRYVRRGPIERRLALQLVDSGTSIGANLEEATAGQSKPDFRAPNVRSQKEARESHFWLRLISETEPDAKIKLEVAPLVQEANELVAILTTLVKNARSNEDRGNAI